jgi:hypothetical protein
VIRHEQGPLAYSRGRLLNTAQRGCRWAGVSFALHTRVGIKGMNQTVSSDLFDFHRCGDSVPCSPRELLMGFDGLYDRYSMVEIPAAESAHVALMTALRSGTLSRENEYLRRAASGTLDLRFPYRIDSSYIAELRVRFDDCRLAIEGGGMPEVKVFNFGGRSFIADGKHRAAMALVYGVDVEVVDVTTALFDSYYMWLARRMGRRPRLYSRNLSFFERARAEVVKQRTREDRLSTTR